MKKFVSKNFQNKFNNRVKQGIAYINKYILFMFIFLSFFLILILLLKILISGPSLTTVGLSVFFFNIKPSFKPYQLSTRNKYHSSPEYEKKYKFSIKWAERGLKRENRLVIPKSILLYTLFFRRKIFSSFARFLNIHEICKVETPKIILSRLNSKIINRSNCKHKNLLAHSIFSYIFQRFRINQSKYEYNKSIPNSKL